MLDDIYISVETSINAVVAFLSSQLRSAMFNKAPKIQLVNDTNGTCTCCAGTAVRQLQLKSANKFIIFRLDLCYDCLDALIEPIDSAMLQLKMAIHDYICDETIVYDSNTLVTCKLCPSTAKISMDGVYRCHERVIKYCTRCVHNIKWDKYRYIYMACRPLIGDINEQILKIIISKDIKRI